MTKDFKLDFNVDAVTIDGGYITVRDGNIDTAQAEELFYGMLRKNEKHWLKEAEEQEHDDIVSALTPDQENKLKEAHAKDYHGTDDDMPDDYERWLEETDSTELKAMLNLWNTQATLP